MVCLEAMIRQNIENPPLETYDFGVDLRRRMERDSRDIAQSRFREDWEKLRLEVDKCKKEALALASFVDQNFVMQEDKAKEAFEKIRLAYDELLQLLEMARDRVRGSIDIATSSKTVEMAELAIKESRRVMLRTYCQNKHPGWNMSPG